jgi:hypothetical protein
VKSRILDNLSQGKAAGYQDILNELLAMVSAQRSPLVQELKQ